MKVWITRYALSEGIFEVDAERTDIAGMIKYQPITSTIGNCYSSKPDWHETFEDALKQAERMRARKITSLRSQLEKLEKLEFTKTDAEELKGA